MLPLDDISPEYRLENIYRRLSEITLSKSQASALVGGRRKLEKLVALGKIRPEKPTNTQNGKWYCNGAEVIRNIPIV